MFVLSMKVEIKSLLIISRNKRHAKNRKQQRILDQTSNQTVTFFLNINFVFKENPNKIHRNLFQLRVSSRKLANLVDVFNA